MLNIYRTSSRAIKSVNIIVPFSALNVAEYLRSCIFEHLRKKGALCTPSFRVVHAQHSHVFDARGTRRANEKLKSSDAIDMGMIDGYEELYCIIISFKTWYAFQVIRVEVVLFVVFSGCWLNFVFVAFSLATFSNARFDASNALSIAKLRSNPYKTDKKTQKNTKNKTKTSVQIVIKNKYNTYSQCPAEVKVVKV